MIRENSGQQPQRPPSKRIGNSNRLMVMFLFFFYLLAAEMAPAGEIPSISLSVPGAAEHNQIIKAQVNISGGSEGISFVTTGLTFLRGYFDHIGFTSNPCLVNDQIQPGCSWNSGREFSHLYYGGPTIEYLITGCGEATVKGQYLGSAHSGPHDTSAYKIKILGGVDARIVAAPAEACVGEEVAFDASSSCGAAEYDWNFGDGTSGSGKVARHSFSNPGNYSVAVTARYMSESDTTSTAIAVRDDCATIRGRVTMAPDGSDLPGTSVVARAAGTHGALSKNDGSYSIIVPGNETYALEAHKSGFFSASGSMFVPSDQTGTWNPVLAMETRDDSAEEELFGDQPNNVDDPVNPALGNFFFSRELFAFPGKNGLNFAFRVAYNSRDNAYDGPLGLGWTHNYNLSLVKLGDDVTVKFGDGRKEFFRYDSGTGTYLPLKTRCHVTLQDRTGGGYLATLGGGLTYEFDTQGRLVRIADLNGNALTLTHTSQLDRITDTAGRQIDFIYAGGRITSIASPYKAGNTAGFQYDGGGNLVNLTDPRGNAWQFSYDSAHRMLTERDRKGVLALTNVYDGQGRVIEQADASGQRTTYAYTPNATGTRVVITPPSGNAVVHQYDAAFNLIQLIDGEGLSAGFGFSSGQSGQLAGATDKLGVPIALEADQWGNITAFRDRLGINTSITYNSRRQPTQISNDQGWSASFTYDANGNLTRFSDSERGIMVATRNTGGQITNFRDVGNEDWKFTYDALGLVRDIEAESIDKKTAFQHDSAGRITQVILPDSLGTISKTYDENGNLLSWQTPLGHQTAAAYDPNDRLTGLTFIPTGAASAYEYDNLGRLLRITWPEGGVTAFAYDGDSNPVSLTDPDGATIQYRYNRRNQLARIIRPSGAETRFDYNANGWLTGLEDGLGNRWTWEYDADGRLVASIDPLGHVSRIQRSPDDRELQITDPNGEKKLVFSDLDGRPLTVIKSDGSFFHRNYNLNSALTQLTDEAGNAWKYSHNSLNRLLSITDPAGQKEAYSYDALGQVKSILTRNKATSTYEYDLDGRLTKVNLPDGSQITYGHQYNPAGTTVMTVTDSRGTTTLTYDRLNRLINKSDTFGNLLAFTYTPGGRLASVTYPESKQVTYHYDGFGRLERIADWLGNQTSYLYDALDRVAQVNLPNGTKSFYNYDARGYLVGIRHWGADNAVIVEYALTRGPDGRIVAKEQTGGLEPAFFDTTATFTYDLSNRMATAIRDTRRSTYRFDHNGNPVLQVSPGGRTSYAYDASNRLTALDQDGIQTIYSYDFAGGRTAKVHDGIETRYLRQDGRTFAAFDGTGALTGYHIWDVGLLYSLSPSGELRVYHGDERGSVAAVTNSGGVLAQQYAYGPYGELLAAAGTGALTNPFRFLGLHGIFTDETGLIHMNARYYDPEIGRFLNEDPIGTNGGPNVYAYAEGDPVNRIDPSGLQIIEGLSPAAANALARHGLLTGETAAVIQGAEVSSQISWNALNAINRVLTKYAAKEAHRQAVKQLTQATLKKIAELEIQALSAGTAVETAVVETAGTALANVGAVQNVSKAITLARVGKGVLNLAKASVITYVASEIAEEVGERIGRYIGESFMWDPSRNSYITYDQAYQDLFLPSQLKAYVRDDPYLVADKRLRAFLSEIGLDYNDYLKIRAQFPRGAGYGPWGESGKSR